MTIRSRDGATKGAGVFTLALFLFVNVSHADRVRPFWTEKSSYIEGDNLYVVGIASNVPSVEGGRKQAFENGKSEIMNFTQISDPDGLVIKTQMTYEESAGQVLNVYRLMYVDFDDINALKSRRLDQTKRNYQRYQQKKEQEINFKRNALNRLDQYAEELEELDRRYDEIVGKVRAASDKALRYVKTGMSREEVESLLGFPRSTRRHYTRYIHDLKYGNYWVIFDNADTVRCLSTTDACSSLDCNAEKTRCTDRHGGVTYYNRLISRP